ncbi:MAG: neutral/alkaline non-lysosomal ceramidase N-terminal domain-containing protein [Erysipelotrichaceae bacterium]|nr:neutral/alkaline non-lysosomal ceramidase N-terminal domain-containing protein [Erysipelotrichaceae bacterium]
MKIGYAERDITPREKIDLAGYGIKRTSTGIHDPLMARVLVIRTVPKETIIVQTDLVGMDTEVVAALAKKLKTKPNRIMICCSHTHSGPVGTVDLAGLEHIFGAKNPLYIEYWLEQVTRCYMEAQLKSSETEIGYQQIKAAGISSDRHDNSVGDDRLSVFVLKQANGSKILLYNFSCHPTIMDANNLEITADLPYGVINELKTEYKGIMFLNGSAGDISTRFTRQASSFAEIEAKGKALASLIRTAAEQISFKPITDIQIEHAQFPVQLKEIPDLNAIRQAMHDQELVVEKAKRDQLDPKEIRVLYSVVEGYSAVLSGVAVLTQLQNLTILVTFMKINDKILIGVPVELFSKLSNKYREQDNRLHYISYCNGYYMYLTNEVAFEKNYYESGTTIFAKGEGERLMAAIDTKLKEYNW